MFYRTDKTLLTAKEKLDRAYNTAFTRDIDLKKIKSGRNWWDIHFIALYSIHIQQHSLLKTQPFWVILWKNNLTKKAF